MGSLQFGVDLGGTKTEVIVLDEDGQTLFRQRRPTPASDYGAILETIAELVAEARQASAAPTCLGVGAPGAPSRQTGLIKNANTTCLIGQPLQADLSQRLGIPVVVENDANCLVLSEATDGAGAGAACVFGVILGTGVGGGLFINGHLVSGHQHIAGEWGHNALPRRANDRHTDPRLYGRRCYCGRQDCIETFLSGPGLSATYGRLGPTPVAVDAAEVAQRAHAGEGQAHKALAIYVEQLAAGLASVINVIDPDVIVMAGGVSNIDAIYPPLRQALGHHVFSPSVQTQIKKARHGDSSGVRGAAWLSRQ